VVFAAAPAGPDEADYRAIYERGLGNLLDALRRSATGDAPPRIVLLSSTSVHGQTAGEWVDESSPTEPLDFRGRVVLRGEEILRACGLPGIALRLGGIYGPGRASLIESVRTGEARLAPLGKARFTNRIHRDDAAGAVAHLLDRDPPPNAIYLGVDHEPAARDDVLRWLAERLGTPLPAPPAVGSTAPARAGARAETNKRCSSAKLRAAGYRFRFPTYRDGYGDLLTASSRAK
jgi:nucleoside-diphosphate-sugar epimerase